MYKDEIISEVWANREAFVFKHSRDMGSMIKELMRRQKISGRLLVDRREKLTKKARPAFSNVGASSKPKS